MAQLKLKEYICKRLGLDIYNSKLRKITTNRTNLVYRLFANNKKFIVKHYLPYVAKIRKIKMHPIRSLHEYNALKLFAKILGKECVPEIINYDDKKHILVLNDINPDLSFEQEENIEKLTIDNFKEIGRLLSILHSKTRNKPYLLKHKVADYTTYDILRTETAASFFPKEVHKFKKDIKTLPHSVVWADCCPKNILIAKKNKDNANNKNNPKNRNSRGAKNDICFIDLEFAHYNAPVIDVGFFIAHILLFAVKNKRYLADMQEGINEFIGSYHHELIKAKYTKRSADKIIRLSFNYAGIIMLHKAYSAAKYKEYSEKKIRKEIKKTAADLISNKTSL